MSRAVDLLLLGAVAFLGWKLLHLDLGFAGFKPTIDPITVTLHVGGEAQLQDLGVILRPDHELEVPSGISDDVKPRQLVSWRADRTTQVIVPVEGPYELRWGAQDEPPPCRARGVNIALEKSAKQPDQRITVTRGAKQMIEVELSDAHAEGIRALVEK